MSKQVRLRRGTSAQHSSFTGADGEVTYDTEKKCLVIHDGATPGGKPLQGFLVLAPGSTSLVQAVGSCLRVTGGSGFEEIAFQVDHDATVNGTLTATHLETFSFMRAAKLLTYAPSLTLDFGSQSLYFVNLTGNLALATANLAWGQQMSVKITSDASVRTLTFPAGWTWLGGAAPASIAANKTGMLDLVAFGLDDTGVVARWSVQP